MRPPRTSAVALWSVVQCAALTPAAAGVHLWPRQPDPPESLALAELVGVQIVAAALLFPLILTDGTTLLVNLALIVPLQHLAGLLSAAPPATIWSATGFVGVWLIGLAGWARLARGDLAQSWLTTAATLLTVGGAVLWYVRAEAVAQAAGPLPDPLRFGPLMAGVAQTVLPRTGFHLGWTLVALPLVTAAAPLAWANRRWPRE